MSAPVSESTLTSDKTGPLLWQALQAPLFTPKRPVDTRDTRDTGPGWRIAATPFTLTAQQGQFLQELGGHLAAFMQAAQTLYADSLAGSAPAFIAEWMNRGKPADLIALSQDPGQRGRLPLVIRPDVLLTETGYAVCELDAVPGGLGFVAALNEAYRQAGFAVVEPEDGLPTRFWNWLKGQVPTVANPTVAVVLNEESADYRLEWQWLTATIREQTGGGHCVAVDASQISLKGERLCYCDAAGHWLPVDVVYRFYELFSRPDTPPIAQIEAAARNGWITLTPPVNFVQEEKLWLALWHHPALRTHWQAHLSAETCAVLNAVIPPGWAMAGDGSGQDLSVLKAKGQPLSQLSDLSDASQKERQLVLKPSGFSPLSWGSRGVTVGHDHPTAVWRGRLMAALVQTDATPWILQRFAKPATVGIEILPEPEATPQAFEGRVRLCPYYLVQPDGAVELVSILATICPKDKKVIHGMSSAIMAPCRIVD